MKSNHGQPFLSLDLIVIHSSKRNPKQSESVNVHWDFDVCDSYTNYFK